jgi:ATP-dependent Lon protease
MNRFDEEFGEWDEVLQQYDFDNEFLDVDVILSTLPNHSTTQTQSTVCLPPPPPTVPPPPQPPSAPNNQLIIQTKVLEKQLVEKDGALSLLRQRLFNVERELLDVKTKLTKKTNQETKADQMAMDRMKREIQSLRAERDAQELEMLEMDHTRKSLLRSLETERKKISLLQATQRSNPKTAKQVSRKDPLEDEFNELEMVFNDQSSHKRKSSQKVEPVENRSLVAEDRCEEGGGDQLIEPSYTQSIVQESREFPPMSVNEDCLSAVLVVF